MQHAGRPNPYTVAIGNESDGHQGAPEEDERRFRRSHSQDISEAGRSTQPLSVGVPPPGRREARVWRDSGVKPLGVAAGGALALPIGNCSASCEEVQKEFLLSCFLFWISINFFLIDYEIG